MGLEDCDIVYCVKPCLGDEELRYSLRSLKNIPHRKVWIFGGCPIWVNRDTVNVVEMTQTGDTKWAKSNSSVKRACNTDGVSQNFMLFNDDFFILKPITELPVYYHKTLQFRAREIAGKNHFVFSGYCRRLLDDARFLGYLGKPTLNYALHIPMMLNKDKMNELFNAHPSRIITRALYGNYYELGEIDTPDVKIYDLENKPDSTWTFASTADASFMNGNVGKYIRNKFRKKCEYEIRKEKNG